MSNPASTDQTKTCVNKQCAKQIPVQATVCPYCGTDQPVDDNIIKVRHDT